MKSIFIDTTDNKKVIVKLTIDGKEFTKEETIEARSSQVVLKLLDKLLKDNKLIPQDLDEIKVNVGPGSFTGTRVGVSIANALAFALDIPVNKTKIIEGKTLVEPQY